jgi:hypothetical protein
MGGRGFSRRGRLTWLTVHIVASVGLLGDSAGFLAVAIRAAKTSGDAAFLELIRVLSMFAWVFGVPLSFVALLTGLALGLGTRWGVFRYPWITTKLLLILSVMAVGGLLIGPALAAGLAGEKSAAGRLVVAAAYDVVALTLATALSVFKPGGTFRWVAGRKSSAPPQTSGQMI